MRCPLPNLIESAYTNPRLAKMRDLAYRNPSLAKLLDSVYNNSKELGRFIKFAIVGTIGAGVDVSILYLMYKVFNWSLLASIPSFTRVVRADILLSDDFQVSASNSLSFTCAVLSNFTWNRLWTFPESRERPIRTQLPQFALVNVIGLVINTLVLISLKALFSHFIPDPFDLFLAKAIAIIVVLFWNFGINRIWTYRGI
jgi:putative flippase GtrA